MSDSTDAILRRAHELIENDKLAQAQEVLVPLLESDGNNPALWWVYAHAVSDSEVGIAALDRALQLDPTYPGARELKAEIELAQGSPVNYLQAESDLASGPPSYADDSIDDSIIDDWETIKPTIEEPPANTNTRAGRGFVLLIAALLIVASGAMLVLSGLIDTSEIQSFFSQATSAPVIVIVEPNDEEDETDLPLVTEPLTEPLAAATASATRIPAAAPADAMASATAVFQTATVEPAAEETAVPIANTEVAAQPSAPATLSPADVSSFIELVSNQLSDFTIDGTGSAARQTELGMTIDMLVCSAPGSEFNARLNAVMQAAADLRASIPAQVEAVAVSLVNCANRDDIPRTIGVDRDVLEEFALGRIELDAFQGAWRLLA